jgi:hypothetical protein
LAEKTVEIDQIMEENRAMKESMDRINNHQILKPEASKFFSKISNRYLAKLFNNQFQNYESEFLDQSEEVLQFRIRSFEISC